MSMNQSRKMLKQARRDRKANQDYGGEYNPTQEFPRKYFRKWQHQFVRKMAAEAALIWGEDCKKAVVSISGKPIPIEANPAKDPDLVATNMKYRVTDNYLDEASMCLTERSFLVECDVIRPKKQIRVRNWSELVAFAKGIIDLDCDVQPDRASVMWVLKNTQICAHLFNLAEMNPGMPIPFTIDWERYIYTRKKQNPDRPFKLRALSIDNIEALRMRLKMRFFANMRSNMAFRFQHHFSETTLKWRRQSEDMTQHEKKMLSEFRKPQKLYPYDHSDLGEVHRNILFRKNKALMKIEKGK